MVLSFGSYTFTVTLFPPSRQTLQSFQQGYAQRIPLSSSDKNPFKGGEVIIK